MTHDLKPDIEIDNKNDPLVQAAVAQSEFGAQTKAAVLQDEGIEAFVFLAERGWTGGLGISPSGPGVPVWVRKSDLQRAQDALKQRVEDSVDLDWNEVDVGEPEAMDDTPLVPSPVLKTIITLGWLVAVAALLFTLYTFASALF